MPERLLSDNAPILSGVQAGGALAPSKYTRQEVWSPIPCAQGLWQDFPKHQQENCGIRQQ